MNRSRALAVDDDPEMCRLLADVLAGQGFSVVAVENSFEAAKMIKTQEFDIIITDLKMEGLQGIDLLEEATRLAPLTPVILITAFGTIESAIQAIKMGAYDYITKPFQVKELVLKVKKALENRQLKKEVKRLKQEIESRYQFQNLIGKSAAMQEVYELIEKIGDSSCNVLITGESGTGKELVARAIHNRSSRREQPFVTLNCGALPDTLMESELFGYEKGAFTGALNLKIGRIEAASGGTLFLDEVGDMSPKTQVDFLRVLQDREMRRLGGTRPISIDVRFIAATNKDLKDEIEQKRFREDLFYRLNVVPLIMPPLRERKEDIPLILESFLLEFCSIHRKERKSISAAALDLLVRYPWPGNIRELRNLTERMVLLAGGSVIEPRDLPAYIRRTEDIPPEITIPLSQPLREMEKAVISNLLSRVTRNRTVAARMLGISLRALHYKIKRFGLDAE